MFSFSSASSVSCLLTISLAAGLSLPASAQKAGAKPAATKAATPALRVYEAYEVQIQPEYAEGQYALQQYLLTKLQRPVAVQQGTVRGLVQVTATVLPDGRLTDVFVARGLSAECNAEALRLVRAMPRWRPARRNNEAVAARIPLTVRFEPPAPKAAPSSGGDLVGLTPSDLRPSGETVVENKPYTYVEQMPVFPGGMEGLVNYIQASLRYPAQAVASKVEGRVFVKFIVGPDGKAIQPEIVKGIGSGCDEEVVRAIRALPPFEPGKQNGRVVSVFYTVPVTFNLQTTPGAPGVTIPLLPTLPKPEDKVYTYVEQMPSIAGGSKESVSIASALQAALELPAEVRDGRSEGRVYVNFVVNPDGTIRDAKVIRSLCPACDAAALAAVAKLPRLEPGKQNGRAVPVQLTQNVLLYSPTHIYDAREAATTATFPGGTAALRQYLTDKMREPSVLAKENLRGTVDVRFVVQTDGQIGAAEILNPLCRSCDEEALRLVRAMPRWTPARDTNGQAIAVRHSLRITMPAPKPTDKASSYTN